MITIAGRTIASINILKYLFIVADNFEAFEILSPRINEAVPVRKDTTVKKFCVADVATRASVSSLTARATGT
jgi:hypothetical protein